MQIFNTPATLSVTDITGKVVIHIVKKLTGEHNGSSAANQGLLKTEIYFLPAETVHPEENRIIRMITY